MPADRLRRPKMGANCPVCGDPAPYSLWIDPAEPEPPCPYGAYQQDQCSHQQREARRAAIWRKVCPDCFDDSGNILPGKTGFVIVRVGEAGYNPMTGEKVRDA